MHLTAASRWHLLHLQHPSLAGLQNTTLASRYGAGLLVHTCDLRDVQVAHARLVGAGCILVCFGCRDRRQRLEPQAKTRSEAVDLYVSSHSSCLWSASTVLHAWLGQQMAPLCRNAEALGNALLVCMIFPWFLCFVFYTGALQQLT